MKLLEPFVDEYGAQTPWRDFDQTEFESMSLQQITKRMIEVDSWLGLSKEALIKDWGADLSNSFVMAIDFTDPGAVDFANENGGDHAAEMYLMMDHGRTTLRCVPYHNGIIIGEQNGLSQVKQEQMLGVLVTHLGWMPNVMLSNLPCLPDTYFGWFTPGLKVTEGAERITYSVNGKPPQTANYLATDAAFPQYRLEEAKAVLTGEKDDPYGNQETDLSRLLSAT